MYKQTVLAVLQFIFVNLFFELQLFLVLVVSIFTLCVCLNVVGTTAVVKGVYSHGLFTLSELISLFLLCYCQRHELIQLQMQHALCVLLLYPTFLSRLLMHRIQPAFFLLSWFVISFLFLFYISVSVRQWRVRYLNFTHIGLLACRSISCDIKVDSCPLSGLFLHCWV